MKRKREVVSERLTATAVFVAGGVGALWLRGHLATASAAAFRGHISELQERLAERSMEVALHAQRAKLDDTLRTEVEQRAVAEAQFETEHRRIEEKLALPTHSRRSHPMRCRATMKVRAAISTHAIISRCR